MSNQPSKSEEKKVEVKEEVEVEKKVKVKEEGEEEKK